MRSLFYKRGYPKTLAEKEMSNVKSLRILKETKEKRKVLPLR